ncbi:hypothetical protein ADJ73_10370 [Arsenicicoccus sp. oral taxon 190]|nr:hypothetical protein ADJ73_10370 [Arsenicicoccus sp. oral taxon 190]
MDEPAASDPAEPDAPVAPGRVVVLGSLNADVFARVERHPRPGETVIGAGGETRAGGKGANQAVAAALCGADVSMVGAVGSDPYAAVALSGLERAGVDVSGVRRVAGPSGLAVITVSDDGENSIIVIPGANGQVSDPELAHLSTLSAADLLILQGEVPVEVVGAAARAATDAGARVIVNLAPVVDLAPEVLRLADPLVVNEHEGAGALEILGTSGRSAGGATGLVQGLRDTGIRSVVMTLGGAGAVVADSEGVTTMPGRRVAVVDTTGAGDAFVGALAAALASRIGLREAAQMANLFASEAVQHEGAQDSYPDRRAR